VRSPDGKTMLVDAGDNAEIATNDVLPQLRQFGVSQLDYVVVTHPDQDHVGGMPTVLKNVPVVSAAFSGQVSANQAYREFLTLVQQKKIAAVKARRGVTLDLGPQTKAEVLNPPDKLFDSDNNNSVVIKLTFGQASFLLEGDAEKEAIASMMDARLNLKATVLKVGHHGSVNATTKAFLQAVDPQYALISVGADNPYGHPHKETLDLLNQRKVATYRTDQRGTITVTTDGTTVNVATAKNPGGGG
jgi:competence protein ComEC